MLHRLCVYGTLRKSEYNYNNIIRIFGAPAFQYIRTLELPGFNLYDNIHYPIAKRTGTDEKIVVDLMRASDLAYDYIAKMEKGAEYIEDIAVIDDNIYSIFIMNEVPPHLTVIDGGDWIQYTSLNDYYRPY